MGNIEIIWDRQKTNTDPSRYRGKIKSSDQNWKRPRRMVYYQSRYETRRSNITKYIHHIFKRIMDKIQDNGRGISVQGLKINNLRFSDDIDLIEESCETLQDSVRLLNDAGSRAGLKINRGKTKTMVVEREDMAN